jgi:hypothetical protein
MHGQRGQPGPSDDDGDALQQPADRRDERGSPYRPAPIAIDPELLGELSA